MSTITRRTRRSVVAPQHRMQQRRQLRRVPFFAMYYILGFVLLLQSIDPGKKQFFVSASSFPGTIKHYQGNSNEWWQNTNTDRNPSPNSNNNNDNNTNNNNSSESDDESSSDWEWDEEVVKGGGGESSASSDIEENDEQQQQQQQPQRVSNNEASSSAAVDMQRTAVSSSPPSIKADQNSVDEETLQQQQRHDNSSSSNNRDERTTRSQATPNSPQPRANKQTNAAGGGTSKLSNKPLQTLEKLQQMLDETDYMTSSSTSRTAAMIMDDFSSGDEDWISEGEQGDDEDITQQQPPPPPPQQQQSDEQSPLWTSKDRSKYKKQRRQQQQQLAEQQQIRQYQQQQQQQRQHPMSSEDTSSTYPGGDWRQQQQQYIPPPQDPYRSHEYYQQVRLQQQARLQQHASMPSRLQPPPPPPSQMMQSSTPYDGTTASSSSTTASLSSSDAEDAYDDTDDGLSYTLPNLPVYLSDAEDGESDPEGDVSSSSGMADAAMASAATTTSSSDNSLQQKTLPETMPPPVSRGQQQWGPPPGQSGAGNNASQQQQQQFPPPTNGMMYSPYPLGYGPNPQWYNGNPQGNAQIPPYGPGYGYYPPNPNYYYSNPQTQSQQQPQQHPQQQPQPQQQQQQQQQYYGYGPSYYGPWQPNPYYYPRSYVPRVETTATTKKNARLAASSPPSSTATPNEPLAIANMPHETAFAHSSPQDILTAIEADSTPTPTQKHASTRLSIGSVFQLSICIMCTTLLCYAAVSPRNLSMLEYNLKFYENLRIAALTMIAPLLSFLLVVDMAENNINSLISGFANAFTFGYIGCFVSQVIAATLIRLSVFVFWEPKVFELAPAVPLPIIPWVLREHKYRPKRITLFIQDFITSCVFSPVLEEFFKLWVLQKSVTLPKNFNWVTRRSKSNHKKKKRVAEPTIRLHPDEKEVTKVNHYVSSMLAVSMGLKLADSIRRVCMYTKESHQGDRGFYAVFRGIFPIHELCGTVTALSLARRDILGQPMPMWKLLLPSAIIHGMANFRGMKPIFKWNSATPWSEMQLSPDFMTDDTTFAQLAVKAFPKIMWLIILCRVAGYCVKNYYMINRQAVKRTTTYAGKHSAFSAELAAAEMLKGTKKKDPPQSH